NGIALDNLSAQKDACNDIVALPNGDVIAIGGSGTQLFAIAYTATGARDASYATAGEYATTASGNALGQGAAATANNELVIAGQDASGAIVVWLTASGQPKPSYGTAGAMSVTAVDHFNAVAMQPNGKAVLAGALANGHGAVVRVLDTGALD